MYNLQPIETERLRLRLFSLADAPVVRELAGDPDVVKTTARLPHPYEEGMAKAWIESHALAHEEGTQVNYAVTMRSDGALIGSISFAVNKFSQWAELGYWIGKPYWGNGYGTEAGRAMVDLGFHKLGFNRIQAQHMANNPASGRIMQKLGMKYEGTRRQALLRFDAYHDLVMYAILRSEYSG